MFFKLVGQKIVRYGIRSCSDIATFVTVSQLNF